MRDGVVVVVVVGMWENLEVFVVDWGEHAAVGGVVIVGVGVGVSDNNH